MGSRRGARGQGSRHAHGCGTGELRPGLDESLSASGARYTLREVFQRGRAAFEQNEQLRARSDAELIWLVNTEAAENGRRRCSRVRGEVDEKLAAMPAKKKAAEPPWEVGEKNAQKSISTLRFVSGTAKPSGTQGHRAVLHGSVGTQHVSSLADEGRSSALGDLE